MDEARAERIRRQTDALDQIDIETPVPGLYCTYCDQAFEVPMPLRAATALLVHVVCGRCRGGLVLYLGPAWLQELRGNLQEVIARGGDGSSWTDDGDPEPHL